VAGTRRTATTIDVPRAEASPYHPTTAAASAPARQHHGFRARATGVVVAVAAFGVAAALALAFEFSGGTADGSPTVKLGIPLLARSATTVELQNTVRTVVGHAGASGTVTFDTELIPDTYDVVVTVDSAAGGTSTAGVDIGAARVVYHARDVDIENGENTLDLHTLH
jgi:hypothetical protein